MYLMRKWRILRITLSIFLVWLVIYYYVSMYHTSLTYVSPTFHKNQSNEDIVQHFELKSGNKTEHKPKIDTFRTACDILKSGQPLNTTHGINPDPYLNVIVPKTDCKADVYLVVYVHSSPHLYLRRDTIRRTWGNVSQYDVPVYLVFIVGEAVGDNNVVKRSSKKALQKEIMTYDDIVQSNFIDTYRNLSHKAIAGLKWITQHCRASKYVLKTDDDAFVNMFLLLRLLRTTEINLGHDKENVLLCNVCNASLRQTVVNRRGKWKTTSGECALARFPSFCQGIAFVMTMNVALALYDASKYVPLLWMDDVYLTGFLPALLPPKTVVLLDAETFYMSTWSVTSNTSHQMLAGEDAFKFIYYHEDNLELYYAAWINLKDAVQTQEFSHYSDALLNNDTQLERKRLKTKSASNR